MREAFSSRKRLKNKCFYNVINFGQKNNRGSRNRTHIDGFGDRCSTFELCPYFVAYENHRKSLYLMFGYLSTTFAVEFLTINCGRNVILPMEI